VSSFYPPLKQKTPASPAGIVRETHLSRKPARASGWIALASVGALSLVSAIYWTDFLGLTSQLAATPEMVFDRNEYWRLLTAIGTHANFQHLLSNALVFGVLSYLLYGYFGPVAYPVLAMAGGVAVMAVSLSTYPPMTILVGASGVTYLMAGFWLTLYLFVERRFSPLKRLLRSMGFSLIVLMPTVFEPTVSYRTHLFGFGVGMVLGLGYFQFNKVSLRRAERVEVDLDD